MARYRSSFFSVKSAPLERRFWILASARRSARLPPDPFNAIGIILFPGCRPFCLTNSDIFLFIFLPSTSLFLFPVFPVHPFQRPAGFPSLFNGGILQAAKVKAPRRIGCQYLYIFLFHKLITHKAQLTNLWIMKASARAASVLKAIRSAWRK